MPDSPINKKPSNPITKGISPAGLVRYKVKDGDSWRKLANTYGIGEWDLIYQNFKTRNPKEINWYLEHYVGCKKKTGDGKNWLFSSTANPGIIYLPTQNSSSTLGPTKTALELRNAFILKGQDLDAIFSSVAQSVAFNCSAQLLFKEEKGHFLKVMLVDVYNNWARYGGAIILPRVDSPSWEPPSVAVRIANRLKTKKTAEDLKNAYWKQYYNMLQTNPGSTPAFLDRLSHVQLNAKQQFNNMIREASSINRGVEKEIAEKLLRTVAIKTTANSINIVLSAVYGPAGSTALGLAQGALNLKVQFDTNASKLDKAKNIFITLGGAGGSQVKSFIINQQLNSFLRTADLKVTEKVISPALKKDLLRVSGSASSLGAGISKLLGGGINLYALHAEFSALDKQIDEYNNLPEN